MPCIMDLRIIPLDKNEKISVYLSRTLDIIQKSGLKHTTGPTSACIEGDWDKLMALAKQCYEANAADSNHLLIDMRIIWRKGRMAYLDG